MKSKNLIQRYTIIVVALFVSSFVGTTHAQTKLQRKSQPDSQAVMGAAGQPTSFTYQGRLSDAAMAANGTYDFEFALFNTEVNGAVINTVNVAGMTVTNGIFTVELDFGAAAFPNEARYLEIRVKRPSDANYTALAPRQPITNAPFAIRAHKATTADVATNAQAVGGTPASNIIKEGDARLTDARQPAAGSGNYIQNTAAQQASTNFNISGNGTAGGTLSASVISATTQFNVGSQPFLRAPGTSNTFAGFNTAGQGTLTGNFNSFFGFNAGLINSSGGENVFVGVNTGNATTSGSNNSFFGTAAGFNNRTGSNNTLIGHNTNVGSNTPALTFATAIGAGATVTSSNTLVLGRSADAVQIPGTLNVAGNLTGNFTLVASNIPNLDAGKITSGAFDAARIPDLSQSYIRNQTNQQSSSDFNISGNGTAGGTLSGNAVNAATVFNIEGARVLSLHRTTNLLVGVNAGNLTMTGADNSFVGKDAGASNTTGGNNSFIGSRAGTGNTTGNSNSFVGGLAGFNNTTGNSNSFLGGGAGVQNTTGKENVFVGELAGYGNIIGSNNTLVGHKANVIGNNRLFSTAIGAGATVSEDNTVVLGRPQGADKVLIPGALFIGSYGVGGNVQLCVNTANNQVATCGSSLRYKENVAPFADGLNLVNRLRPITFDWKSGGRRDLGLIAEEVAEVEPLLADYDKNGQIEGIKYDRIGVVLVNAVKEQQAQIEAQARRINELKQIVCALKPEAGVCK